MLKSRIDILAADTPRGTDKKIMSFESGVFAADCRTCQLKVPTLAAAASDRFAADAACSTNKRVHQFNTQSDCRTRNS
jgi:hypothetical protein